jgi:hypothetical protein
MRARITVSVTGELTPPWTILMLDSVASLKGYKLNCLDGEIGHVKQFYFDDHYWTIRHLVADTGGWLLGRQVLISPYALRAVSRTERHISLDLTKAQIEQSPPLRSDQPVSRQFEQEFFGYYDWPMYWTGASMWGVLPYISRDRDEWRGVDANEKQAWDPHLRSTDDVAGHRVEATDGAIGKVVDFIIDDRTWAIRYLVIDTHDWWFGKQVLMSPQWIERVSWPDKTVSVTVTRETIQRSPEYTDGMPVTRDYEERLHHHYGRQGHWLDESAAAIHSR